jgi:hypothetical protein
LVRDRQILRGRSIPKIYRIQVKNTGIERAAFVGNVNGVDLGIDIQLGQPCLESGIVRKMWKCNLIGCNRSM